MLLGVMRALNELRVRCPQEVSLVGFDDFPWTQHLTPPLTVLGQPAHEIGKKAFEMLLSKIRAADGTEVPDSLIQLQAELKVRQSTAAARLTSVVDSNGQGYQLAPRDPVGV
jgi:LacI family transcriptional regulator